MSRFIGATVRVIKHENAFYIGLICPAILDLDWKRVLFTGLACDDIERLKPDFRNGLLNDMKNNRGPQAQFLLSELGVSSWEAWESFEIMKSTEQMINTSGIIVSKFGLVTPDNQTFVE